MKALLWFGFALSLSNHALGESHYSPLLCPLEDTYLQVTNTSLDFQTFWFQAPGSTPFEESAGEIKPQGVLTLALADLNQGRVSGLALKAHSPALKFSASCRGNSLSWSLDQKVSPWKKLQVGPQEQSLQLSLTNLSHAANTVELRFEGFWGTLKTESIPLEAEFKTLQQELQIPRGTQSITLQAPGRWIGKVLSSSQQEIPLTDLPRKLSPPAPGPRYFLFASRDGDSQGTFVVPMVNPKLIQESLEQIAKPDSARLLVARIEKSLSGLNRDLSALMKTPWSWQVLEAQNYADFAHISCDGSPQIVEEKLNAWFHETGGTICFWSYRVVREVSVTELTQSPSWSLPGQTFLPHRH